MKKVCATCGSDDLEFDALVKWDEEKDDFVIVGILDYVYCVECGGYVFAKDVVERR